MSKIIKFGVVGLGRGKNVMTDILGADHVALCAICDRNPKKRADALAHFEKQGEADLLCFEDYDEMLKADIDAVYIATDAIYHVPFVIKALEAGKHVLSEIPAVNSLEEAKLLKLQGNRMVNGDLIAGIFYLVSTDEEGNFAFFFFLYSKFKPTKFYSLGITIFSHIMHKIIVKILNTAFFKLFIECSF